MASSSLQSIVVHTTPPLTPLPASDIESIYYISLFQSACPGRWKCQVGDWAENRGALPYITHLDHLISSRHVSSLPGFSDPDAGLSSVQRADALAWTAYIHGKVIDLVYHSLYSLPPNYHSSIGRAHLSNLTFPKSQFIPQRIRGMYKSRLQHVGLWGLGGINEGDLVEDDQKRLDDLYVTAPGGTVAPRAWTGWRSGRQFEERRRKAGEEELKRLIKEVFAPLDRRLKSAPYFFGDRPCTPDLWLFASLSLVLVPTLPNPLLSSTLKAHFPDIISHFERIQQLLFPVPSPGADPRTGWSQIPRIPAAQPLGWWDSIRSIWQSTNSVVSAQSSAPPSGDQTAEYGARGSGTAGGSGSKRVSKAERDFRRARWLWYAGAVGAMVAYVFASGLITIQYVGDEADTDSGDEEDEVDEEEAAELAIRRELVADDDEDGDEEEDDDLVIVVEEDEPGSGTGEAPIEEGGQIGEEELQSMAEEVADDLENPNPYNDRED